MSYIDGAINRYLFYNEENFYSVIKVKIVDTDETELTYYEPTIVVCGFFPKLDKHSNYRFLGKVTHHDKYGIQYLASSFERVMDNTYNGLVDYLSSDLFKGIGKKTAERIVEKLGLEALDLIADDKNVLNDIPRMKETLKNSIYQQIIDNRDMEHTLIWLYGFEISPRMAMKIYSVYANDTVQTIKDNPYVLIDHVEGIGFRRADAIGLKVGFKPNSDVRISAVIYFLMNEYMNKYGDTYLEKEKLVDYTIKYLNTDSDQTSAEVVKERLSELIFEGKITERNESLSLTYLFNAEKYIAKRLMEFNREFTLPHIDIETYISDFENNNSIQYTKAQKQAILGSLSSCFSIITGGPGTGKTTVIKGITDIYQMIHNYPDITEEVILAAPTGKAAKRLSLATGISAKTIHKILGYDYEGNFVYDEFNQLDTKLIIIDEVSMMDCLLAKRLLKAIPDTAQIVFVGDANQLPSVGAGEVLNDLITSDLFNVIKLDVIHRQAENSQIISLAYDILNKEINRTIFDNFEDRVFIRINERFVGEKILSEIRILTKQGYSLLDDIQVLVPVYRGLNGIDRINDLIQKSFNYKNRDFSISYGDKTFYYNDKVMQLTNQPEDNIMNGDQGVISGITEDSEVLVDFSGNTVKYNKKDLDSLTLAYAVSIHKSQGSEFKVVIMPVVKSYSIMLKRKLLYTGVTRAKEKLILLGEFEAYKRGVLGMSAPRKTLLKDFLQDEISSDSSKELTIEDFL